MRHRLIGLTLTLGVGLLSSFACATELPRSGELIGTWCDTATPGAPQNDYIIEIWRDAQGRYSYHQIVRVDGKSEPGINSYRAEKRGETWYVKNDFNEYVRIDAAAFLRLYDDIGFIRKALAVPPNTQPGKCRHHGNKG